MTRLADAQAALNALRDGDPANSHQASPAGWPISRSELARQLQVRLQADTLNSFPDQGQTSRCGPAAFLYCLLEDRPDLYVKLAVELWRDGVSNLRNGPKGRDYPVRPGAGTKSSTLKAEGMGVSALDWMMMGSLSKPDNGHADPGDELTAITFPSTLGHWFTAAGCTIDFNAFDSAIGDGWLGSIDVFDLQKGLSFFPRDWVVLEIDPHLIDQQPQGTFQRHWVVINQRSIPTFGNLNLLAFLHVKARAQLKSEKVDMLFACWGKNNNLIRRNIMIDQFLKDWYGIGAVSRIP